MGKNKRDLLKKKLIAQQMAQAAASYQPSAQKSGAATAAMPMAALKSKASGITMDDYSFVARDVRKIILVVIFFLICFAVIYYFDQKAGLLTKLSDKIFSLF